VVLGYALAAITKPIFAVATSVSWLVTARFVDRVGKGIRGAPRDALIADLSPEAVRGASFGLRQSLDTTGAFLGPLLAMALLWLTSNDIPRVFWFAVIPASLAVALLVFGVKEPRTPGAARKVHNPLALAELRRLGPAFRRLATFAFVFTLARFSEAFLILKAESVGLGLTLVPAVLVLMNLAYAAAAYPAGILSDRGDRTHMLLIGLMLLLSADLVLAVADGLAAVALGVLLWGLHMGFTQGIVASMVADAVPEELRGTAYGVINLVMGIAMLAASLLAGALWDVAGPAGTFLSGAAICLLSAMGLPCLRRRP